MLESLNIFKKPKTSKLSYELDNLSKKYLATSARKNIQKAVDFADKAHDGQFRKSGEPFLIHPINVGIILAFPRAFKIACSIQHTACSIQHVSYST